MTHVSNVVDVGVHQLCDPGREQVEQLVIVVPSLEAWIFLLQAITPVLAALFHDDVDVTLTNMDTRDQENDGKNDHVVVSASIAVKMSD